MFEQSVDSIVEDYKSTQEAINEQLKRNRLSTFEKLRRVCASRFGKAQVVEEKIGGLKERQDMHIGVANDAMDALARLGGSVSGFASN